MLNLLKRFNQVLGVLNFEAEALPVPKELEEALAKRLEARAKKDWALADTLRDFITSRGFVIEDTPQGARLKKQ